ncbi:ermin [Emydura macquarii macquarii]|uniref:ermin n=1 Tax=Emydura macquarii macquarii TaxID=1129001 RepID=UPI00352B04FC
MTEEVPIASSIPEYYGNVSPEKAQLQVIDIIDEIAKSVGTVPCENAGISPEALLKNENQEDNKNSVENNTISGALDGEKQCEEKQEENNATIEEGSADIPSENTRTDEEKSEGPCEEIIPVSTKECETTRQEERNVEQPQEETATHANKPEEFQTARAPEEAWMLEPKEQIKADTQLEEQENVEEEEEEEVKVQLIESKKENGGESPLKKQENDREESPPTSPSFNFQAEKPEEQPGSGKKNDISRHSYSRYNTISYRKIRKGNTKQRIDEFESMMHL